MNTFSPKNHNSEYKSENQNSEYKQFGLSKWEFITGEKIRDLEVIGRIHIHSLPPILYVNTTAIRNEEGMP